jgi:hypothetical protein
MLGGRPTTPLKNMKVKWDYYSQYIYIWKVIEVMLQTTTQLKDMAVLKSNFVGTFGAKLLEPIQSFRATFSRREPTKLEMSGCRA